MRLIDADALIADLETDVAIDQDTLDYEDLTEINRINIQFDKDCKKNAIDLLKNAPTIEPERTGHWVKGANHGLGVYTLTCDKCGYVDVSSSVINFCPNCGAKMLKEGD